MNRIAEAGNTPKRSKSPIATLRITSNAVNPAEVISSFIPIHPPPVIAFRSLSPGSSNANFDRTEPVDPVFGEEFLGLDMLLTLTLDGHDRHLRGTVINYDVGDGLTLQNGKKQDFVSNDSDFGFWMIPVLESFSAERFSI
jgi:hypothetical protein